MRVRSVFKPTALAAAILGATLVGPGQAAQAAGGSLDYNVQVNVVYAGGHLSVIAINLTNGKRCNVGAHPCVKAVVHRVHGRKAVQLVAPTGTVFRSNESYWGYSNKTGDSQNVMPWSPKSRPYFTNRLVRPDNRCVQGYLWGQVAAFVQSIPVVSDGQTRASMTLGA